MFHFKEVKYKNILNIEYLVIPGKKVTSIIGESGSGKTTLLRHLNKLISYDEGEILYKNHSLREIDSMELRRKVIMLPQTPAIFNGTIKDNLLIGLKFSDKSMVEDVELLRVLQLVHLNKTLTEDAEKLSGGEKQRLGLGRVLLMNPEVSLLDEPSSALDEETENLIIEKIVQFSRKQQKTLVMVTHSKKIAEAYSDFIVEIKEGKVVHQRGK
ncbi:putative ABC transport system ATP-binding protein [Anaerovirgula multivorans]|uniref:Putative ABC transport system ATP-binding protein n=1 Tax=Anaerovirgula multivorans TaxID=312168 RepID=A0A239AHS3_9FIRM|nr:ABC transporter ATP-binding protein [Anaerovirgula multivorans]SNR94912.1 putative ABC transport system ATP-binding protein [Anaerovirgula multivorans]